MYLPKGKYCGLQDGCIWDDRKLLSITFLTISAQYATFFHKMAICNYYYYFLFTIWLPVAILDDRKSLSIAFLAISDQYAFFHKMAAGGHFGWPKITFVRISRHFRSIRNFFLVFKWPPAAILEVRFGPFWITKNNFRLFQINTQYTIWLPFQINTFFSQNGCRRPFWMTENHFRSHFWPFQINTKLWYFFFTKWLPAAILDDRKSLLFWPFQINMQLLFLFYLFHKMAAGGHFE